MHEDTLAKAALSLWLFGWVAIWPFARIALQRTRAACRDLLAIFAGGILLEIASIIYVWDLRASGFRDWPMALFFPQTIASVAWLASLFALFRNASKSKGNR